MIPFATQFFVKQKSGEALLTLQYRWGYRNAGQANYAASKTGIIGLTKSSFAMTTST